MTSSALRGRLPFLVTAVVTLLLWLGFGAAFPGFASTRVVVNLLGDNSFLGIVAVGMTFVILSGGIDLSVGSLAALCSIVLAVLTEDFACPGIPAIACVLLLGTLFGAVTGAIIQGFGSPPFIVTLAGMFLARGLAFIIHIEAMPIRDPFVRQLSLWALPAAGTRLPLTAFAFLGMIGLGLYLLAQTRFGRNVYAIGGNEEGARLLGLPVGRTKILVYTFSGFCSALAAAVFAVYQLAGNPSAGVGWELDAIAAVVIGGTLLTGGVGGVGGTFLGILIFGMIQTAITFQGALSSWWTKVAIGALLLVFILIQRLLTGLTASDRPSRAA